VAAFVLYYLLCSVENALETVGLTVDMVEGGSVGIPRECSERSSRQSPFAPCWSVYTKERVYPLPLPETRVINDVGGKAARLVRARTVWTSSEVSGVRL